MRWDTGRQGKGIPHPPAFLKTVQIADKKIKRAIEQKRKQLFNLTLAK
jgi:hypothetical protein